MFKPNTNNRFLTQASLLLTPFLTIDRVGFNTSRSMLSTGWGVCDKCGLQTKIINNICSRCGRKQG